MLLWSAEVKIWVRDWVVCVFREMSGKGKCCSLRGVDFIACFFSHCILKLKQCDFLGLLKWAYILPGFFFIDVATLVLTQLIRHTSLGCTFPSVSSWLTFPIVSAFFLLLHCQTQLMVSLLNSLCTSKTLGNLLHTVKNPEVIKKRQKKSPAPGVSLSAKSLQLLAFVFQWYFHCSSPHCSSLSLERGLCCWLFKGFHRWREYKEQT